MQVDGGEPDPVRDELLEPRRVAILVRLHPLDLEPPDLLACLLVGHDGGGYPSGGHGRAAGAFSSARCRSRGNDPRRLLRRPTIVASAGPSRRGTPWRRWGRSGPPRPRTRDRRASRPRPPHPTAAIPPRALSAAWSSLYDLSEHSDHAA